MANRDIVAIGTSAGGVEALLHLTGRLPPHFPAAILITIHLPSEQRSVLDELLTKAGQLPAAFATDGEALSRGRIFIAPPGRHLLVDGNVLSLGDGPRENHTRPAIDPMLRSAAVCCAPRCIGVVLTGSLGDGSSGLWALNQCGGIAVVQDPSDAAFAEMPQLALNRSMPQYVSHLHDLPVLLERLVLQPVGDSRQVPEALRLEVEIARSGPSRMRDMDSLGNRSVLTCPECQGVMWEIEEDKVVRYRCHIGHSFGGDILNILMEENVRRALGSALRVLEERVALMERLRVQDAERGHGRTAETWANKKAEIQREAKVIRRAILRANGLSAA
jgi:two-component system, chemotaxis family, protein-glutamate methylesterase/glutaminase